MNNTNNNTPRPCKQMQGFNVYEALCSAKGRWRKGELLDTVFYVKGMTEDEVRDSEIRHFPGCSIMVRKQRAKRSHGGK